jgi:plasmid stabilization system protein ParE
MEKIAIIWDTYAEQKLMELYHHIAEKSMIQADNVLNAVFETTESLEENPEKFPLDRFKIKNDNSYRAFEIYNIRISYRFIKNKVYILRVRHVKQNPLFY